MRLFVCEFLDLFLLKIHNPFALVIQGILSQKKSHFFNDVGRRVGADSFHDVDPVYGVLLGFVLGSDFYIDHVRQAGKFHLLNAFKMAGFYFLLGDALAGVDVVG
ncbi:hypothetical protein SDC9_195078 [bioreactor metagenome]|uniref:Uncharacterized protein n=1 Tax=bioreactor metagenome TaxID=1076179 RepID=A0A645I990_9ZZZZ